jgi:hypothetical protein
MKRTCTGRGAAVILALACTAGCAPDAWQNTRASGLNAYLSTVETQCQPLWFGNMRLRRFDSSDAGDRQSDFTSLLDTTSRLYYGRITPAQFREGVQSLAMTSSDPRTNQTIDCMIRTLPASRPSGPG